MSNMVSNRGDGRQEWKATHASLDVRIGERLVTVYHDGELVKSHARERGERRYTDPEDVPEQKIAFLLRTCNGAGDGRRS